MPRWPSPDTVGQNGRKRPYFVVCVSQRPVGRRLTVWAKFKSFPQVEGTVRFLGLTVSRPFSPARSASTTTVRDGHPRPPQLGGLRDHHGPFGALRLASRDNAFICRLACSATTRARLWRLTVSVSCVRSARSTIANQRPSGSTVVRTAAPARCTLANRPTLTSHTASRFGTTAHRQRPRLLI